MDVKVYQNVLPVRMIQRMDEKNRSNSNDNDESSVNNENNNEERSSAVAENKKSASQKTSTTTSSSEEDEEDGRDDDDDDDDGIYATESTDSSFLLNPNDEQSFAFDGEGITLLRQIFPDESTDALRELHRQHVQKQQEVVSHHQHHPTPTIAQVPPIPPKTSSSIPKISNDLVNNNNNNNNKTQHRREEQHQSLPTKPVFSLPDDFLRLPTSVAVRRSYVNRQGKEDYRYEMIEDLQQKVLREYPNVSNQNQYFTAVLERDKKLGLGLSLCGSSSMNCLKVVGLLETPEAENTNENGDVKNPSADAGIQVDDYVIGINGSAFSSFVSKSSSKSSSATATTTLMKNAIKAIQESPNPVILHIQRYPQQQQQQQDIERPTTSLLDSTVNSDVDGINDSLSSSTTTCSTTTYKTAPAIHQFASALTARSLIQSSQDEKLITKSLRQYTDRTRQWESNGSFRIDGTKNHTMVKYFDPNDLPPEMAELFADHPSYSSNNNKCLPSTPTLTHDSPLIPTEYTQAFFGMDNNIINNQNNYFNNYNNDLPTPKTNNHDTQSSRFGYPGIKARILSPPGQQQQQQQTLQKRPDIFVPLYGIRKALSPRIVNIFVEGDTRIAYTIWVYDVESGKEWYAPIRYFQDFADLRTATMSLAPEIGDLEFPKQPKFAFLARRGNEAQEPEDVRQAKSRQLEHFLRGLCSLIYTCRPLHPDVAEIAIHVQSFLGVEAGLAETDLDQQRAILEESPLPNHNPQQCETRMELKRSIQRYTWRLFLLNTMKAIVNDFVDTARSRGPKLKDIESLEAKGRSNLKARAMSDLERIQNFLDQLVDLILDGCYDDFQSITSRREYGSIRMLLDDGEAYRDRLVREAVREQVEIEVYVPLRSVVSRLLVNGWRHEDMEVQFKIKELRKRPQGLFRIPPDKISPSHWQSVALILKRGVGMSTLPCAKLRAIVEAAREISRLHEREHGTDLLGADDFLPIFIFCVVRAEMERPCALCVLLRTLCDRINRIGEIGYFLASFEAAITHIQEIDLTEDKEEMLSFLTVPFTEIPLDESH